MGEIDPKLVERMVALVRELGLPGGIVRVDKFGNMLNVCDEARAIVAELPEPVDPDLMLARECAAALCEELKLPNTPSAVLAGNYDDDPRSGVGLALAAIKRVRGGA